MIAQDKLLHFIFSFFLALVEPAWAVMAGLGKELLDLAGPGVAEFGDLAADLLGILAGILVGQL
ncbi:MAG: hypothetical protein HYV26_06000 [Candidatus Hydrogenedentes bacterium]|nr:hypothetical protein [Candidatus Hydrogenedentota bacterium]